VNTASNTESCPSGLVGQRQQIPRPVEGRAPASPAVTAPPVDDASLNRCSCARGAFSADITRTRAAASSIASGGTRAAYQRIDGRTILCRSAGVPLSADSALHEQRRGVRSRQRRQREVSSPTSPSTSRVVTTNRASVGPLSHLPSVSSSVTRHLLEVVENDRHRPRAAMHSELGDRFFLPQRCLVRLSAARSLDGNAYASPTSPSRRGKENRSPIGMPSQRAADVWSFSTTRAGVALR